MKKHPSLYFLVFGLALLLVGMFFGVLAGAQYILPGLWRDTLPFTKLRPLHVSMVVFWLLLAASGCVYFFLHSEKLLKKSASKWLNLQLALIGSVAVGSVACYLNGTFGGREYWEFPPALAVPLVLGWLIFLGVYVKSVFRRSASWPIYYWMWLTGIVFFLLSLTESYLWLLPYFRDNIVRDMTVQWKSYGSIVGSWNQLIYGTAFFLMARITGNREFLTSRKTFFFYFLGLFNLMFNWGHHIYTLSVAPYIRYVSYLVSMTELLIFGRIVWEWRSSLTEGQKFFYKLPYRFLMASDFWVFLNLGLAILMSVPALNLHTHGTHITVAHAMGTTIGINTMILLAVAHYIFNKSFGALSAKQVKFTKAGYWLSNGSLLVFWLALIGAGVGKSWIQWYQPELPHTLLMQKLVPLFAAFIFAGVLLFLGLVLVVVPLLQRFFTSKSPETNPLSSEIMQPLKSENYTNEYA